MKDDRYPAVTGYLGGVKGFWLIFIPTLFLLSSCVCTKHTPALEPLATFPQKIEVLVTTTVRGYLRGDTARQELLVKKIPSLETKSTVSEIYDELKNIEQLNRLPEMIEADIQFELKKPENQGIKDSFTEPGVQREVAAAVVHGMRRAIDQLGGGKDGT